ncbi:nuclear transport factor 2 family protein [Pseudomonas sp. Bi70]|uniref:nuclear transport factor 2 family protein n=1 Tax=Pseudomonas sp. Bi70 TaxID=2821127 RepID=UPI001E30C5EE|nr:nuclear transport factor 2 family protein [Pseudomonas sp. Bi70]
MISPISEISLLEERIRVLEAESSVRHLLNRYMLLCDVPGPTERASALGQLFCLDSVWQGVGSRYAAKFGRVEGREAIVSMLMSYLPPAPHFVLNVHFLSGEQIAVDGLRAKGRWLMQQLSRYDTGQSESIIAALSVEFVWEADAWRISSFSTERLDAYPLVNPQGALL